MPQPSWLRYTPDIETIPADEDSLIAEVLETTQQLLMDHERRTGRRQRDVHVKSHGGLMGEWEVPDNLPPELAQGLFCQSGRYEARVRFSNSSPDRQADAIPDGRGVAIQLRGVSGTWLSSSASGEATQDFLMVNHPVFVARDVRDYLRVQRVRLEALRKPVSALPSLFTEGHWNPFDWRWHEALSTLQVLAQSPRNPLAYQYYSMVPIRYGDYVAKYRLQMAVGESTSALAVMARLPSDSDAMGRALAETLRTRSVRFVFQVQLCASLSQMPVEDATVEWPERLSPYRTVASLNLPQQSVLAADGDGVDRWSFNVWNALIEHQPLGGINRVRRRAYELSAVWRHTVQPGPQDKFD